jgi:arylsulfatase
VKSAFVTGGSLGAPATAFQYDWNILPLGQQMWLEHLLSYEKYPPLQAPKTYNLSGIASFFLAGIHHGCLFSIDCRSSPFIVGPSTD